MGRRWGTICAEPATRTSRWPLASMMPRTAPGIRPASIAASTGAKAASISGMGGLAVKVARDFERAAEGRARRPGEDGTLGGADVHDVRAAGVEGATGGRVGRIGQLAPELDAFGARNARARDRREQRPGV